MEISLLIGAHQKVLVKPLMLSMPQSYFDLREMKNKDPN